MRRLVDRGTARDHRDAAELLPWYVNGTLEGAELERLALHLESCDRCRAELDQQRQLSQVLRTSEEMTYSPQRAFEQLRERLDHEEEFEGSKREAPSDGLLGRFYDGFRGLAVPVRWALAAQLIVIVALGAALLRDQGGRGEFRTLTNPSAVGTGQAPPLRVVFEAATPEGDIRALLVESGSRIVDGPSPFGVYTVEIGAETDTDVLDFLRSSGMVVFAEPVGGNAEVRP